MRLTALALIVTLAVCTSCNSSPLDGLDPDTQIKADPLAVGSWDMVTARAAASTTLPFACNTAQDKTSWPCIPNAVVDTIMSGIVLLDANGVYGVAIVHRVQPNGSTQVIVRVTDESGVDNSAGIRTGTWGRSAMRIVLYPYAISSPTKYGDLADTSFVHGMTTMSINGAKFMLR
jgi:hypothetical protein